MTISDLSYLQELEAVNAIGGQNDNNSGKGYKFDKKYYFLYCDYKYYSNYYEQYNYYECYGRINKPNEYDLYEYKEPIGSP